MEIAKSFIEPYSSDELKQIIALAKKELKDREVNSGPVVCANGDRIIFPDVEPGDQYGVGDKVELPDDKKPTFERVMPDGSTIVVKDGILKKIIPAEDEETVKAQKIFNCGYSAKTVEIFSESKSEPYKVGNKVRVNGKEGVMFGRFRNGNIQISVLEGEISAIKNIPRR